MKILHIPFCYYPDPVGGTEVYVAALAHKQKNAGHEAEVAAPGEADTTYTHEQTTIRRYAIPPDAADQAELYGLENEQITDRFVEVLKASRPDLVHLHAYTRGVSSGIADAVKQHGIPLVFTYHTPSVGCQRGTLLRWGAEVCDGVPRLGTCTRCTLHGHGLSRPLSSGIGCVPVSLGRTLGKIKRQGKVWTALRMRSLMHMRHTRYRYFMDKMDRIVVLNRWTHDMLLRQNISPDRLAVVRHGLSSSPLDAVGHAERVGPEEEPLRVAFIGRLDRNKGLDTVLSAVHAMPDLRMALHIYGVDQSNRASAYVTWLHTLAGGDPRIVFREAVPHDRIVDMLGRYHLLAVPSRIMETGPLVALEAFAAGIPVIGTDMGGIPEWVRHNENGLLLPLDQPEVWGRTFQRLAADRAELQRLTAGVRPPRTMGEVSDEMMTVYEQVISA